MPAIRPSVQGAVITGWGTALPPKVLTNQDLEGMMDTSHEWIVERTGIHERRVGGTTAGLSIESGRAALDMAGLDPTDIDALVLATTTPDRTVPATSATVQKELGLTCGAFDINAACSGWVYGLVNAHGLIAMGAEKILLIGTDTLARITDWDDRNTAILFADGSGATVLEAVEGPGQLLGWDLDADGHAERFLYSDLGGVDEDLSLGTLVLDCCDFAKRDRLPRHRHGVEALLHCRRSRRCGWRGMLDGCGDVRRRLVAILEHDNQ